MNTEEFNRYARNVQAQADRLVGMLSKVQMTTYRGFIDRQIRNKDFTPEQAETLQEIIALMVERHNAGIDEQYPERTEAMRYRVKSRNPTGHGMKPRAGWRAEKAERWKPVNGQWESIHGLTVPPGQVGDTLTKQLENGNEPPAAIIETIRQRRAELRRAGQINEAFRQWADWMTEEMEALITLEGVQRLRLEKQKMNNPP